HFFDPFGNFGCLSGGSFEVARHAGHESARPLLAFDLRRRLPITIAIGESDFLALFDQLRSGVPQSYFLIRKPVFLGFSFAWPGLELCAFRNDYRRLPTVALFAELFGSASDFLFGGCLSRQE